MDNFDFDFFELLSFVVFGVVLMGVEVFLSGGSGGIGVKDLRVSLILSGRGEAGCETFRDGGGSLLSSSSSSLALPDCSSDSAGLKIVEK